MKTIATTAATLALAIAAFASPASAKVEQVSITVEFADLDLTSEAGLQQLESRLDGAINMACGRPDMKVRASIRAVRQCRADMGAKADIVLADIAERPERYAKAHTITVRG